VLLLPPVLFPPMFPPDESSLLIHAASSLIVMAHYKSERIHISDRQACTEMIQADVHSCHSIASSDPIVAGHRGPASELDSRS
jgi:hypothetical protein